MKQPKFTQKHYKIILDLLHKGDVDVSVVYIFAGYFEKDNPRFSNKKFYAYWHKLKGVN